MIVFFVVLLIAAGIPAEAGAAGIEFTASVQSAFDATVKAADSAGQARLQSLYGGLQRQYEQDKSCDVRLKALRLGNEQAQAALNKRLKEADAGKLAKLEAQLKEAKARYQPLFDLYASVNRQLAAARKLGSREITAALRSQAELLKPAVQMARLDVRNKESALQTAKAARTAKVKKIRALLADTASVKLRIKAGRSSVSATNKQLAAEWKSFAYYIKKADVKGSIGSLTTLASLLSQIIAQKQSMCDDEGKIGSILQQAALLL